MRLQESYVFTCVCGQNQTRLVDQESFKCPNCQRHSVIDFRSGLSEKELLALLDTLDRRRDAIVTAIETRRQRMTA